MLKHAQNLLARLKKDTRGLTAVEYAVLGAMVVAAITAAGVTFTPALEAAFLAILP